jgi:hypothetical protein
MNINKQYGREVLMFCSFKTSFPWGSNIDQIWKKRRDGPASNSKQRGHYTTGKQIYNQNEKHFTFRRHNYALIATCEAVTYQKHKHNGTIRLEER